MELLEAMEQRHSVRSYTDRNIEGAIKAELQTFIEECNRESGLHIQPVFNEPCAFDSALARYGHFSGVKDYIAVIGKKGGDTEEKGGYYGEKIVLRAQQLGLNTCWVALTYKKIKNAFQIDADEKLYVVIALGYGATQGTAHKSKPAGAVSNISASSPRWFSDGVCAALLAPTAINQQKFMLTLKGENTVYAKAGLGPHSKLDLGIVKYHFELGAGQENFQWA